MASRQAEQQRALKEKGLCVSCWKPVGGAGTRCTRCRKKDNIRARKKNGYRPWKKGGRGRPPIQPAPRKVLNTNVSLTTAYTMDRQYAADMLSPDQILMLIEEHENDCR